MNLTPTAFAIYRDGEHPINGELSTHINLRDEGGGEFIEIIQWLDGEEQKIRLEFDEIRLLVKAAQQLKGKAL